MPDTSKQEIIDELDRRGEFKDARKKEIVEELARRGAIHLPKSFTASAKPTPSKGSPNRGRSTGIPFLPQPNTTTSPLAMRNRAGRQVLSGTIGPPHPQAQPNLLQRAVEMAGQIVGYPKGLLNAAALPIHQALHSSAGHMQPDPAGAARDAANIQRLQSMNIFQRGVALEGQNAADPLMGRPAAQGIRDTAERAQYGPLGAVARFSTDMATDPTAYVLGPAGKLLPKAGRVAVSGAFGAQMASSGIEKMQKAIQTGDKSLGTEAALDLAMAPFALAHAKGEMRLEGHKAETLATTIRAHNITDLRTIERAATRYKVKPDELHKALNRQVADAAKKPTPSKTLAKSPAKAMAEELAKSEGPGVKALDAPKLPARKSFIKSRLERAKPKREVKPVEPPKPVAKKPVAKAKPVDDVFPEPPVKAQATGNAAPAAEITKTAEPPKTPAKPKVKVQPEGNAALVNKKPVSTYDELRSEMTGREALWHDIENGMGRKLDADKPLDRAIALNWIKKQPKPAAESHAQPTSTKPVGDLPPQKLVSTSADSEFGDEHDPDAPPSKEDASIAHTAVQKLVSTVKPGDTLATGSGLEHAPIKYKVTKVTPTSVTVQREGTMSSGKPFVATKMTHAQLAELEANGSGYRVPTAGDKAWWDPKKGAESASKTPAAAEVRPTSEAQKTGNVYIDTMPDDVKASLDALKKPGLFSAIGPDPVLLGHLIKVGTHFVKTGLKEFGKWAATMRDTVSAKLTDEHLKETWEKIAGREKRGELFTGVRNAITEPERSARGLAEVERQAYSKVGDAFLAGKESHESGKSDHTVLAESVARLPRVLSVQDVGLLAYGRHLMKLEHDTLSKQLNAAVDANKPEEVKVIQGKLAELAERFNKNDQALVKGGREQSAAFNARKLIIYDDGNIDDALQKMRNAKGRRLTAAETEIANKHVEELKQVNLQIAQLEKQLAEHAAELAAQKIKMMADKANGRQGNKKDFATEREVLMTTLYNRLKNRLGIRAGLTLSPTESIILGKIAASYVEEGVWHLKDIESRMQEDMPELELEDRDVHDALSGYGRETEKGEPDAIKKRIRELKNQAMNISKAEDELKDIDTRVQPEDPNYELLTHQLRHEVAQHQKLRAQQEEIYQLEERVREHDAEQRVRDRAGKETPSATDAIKKKGTLANLPINETQHRLNVARKAFNERQSALDRIDNLHAQIELMKKGVDTRTDKPTSRPVSVAEKALRNEVKQRIRQMDVKDQIQELEDKLARNDVEASRTLKKMPRTADEERLTALRKEFADRQAALANVENLNNLIRMEEEGHDTRRKANPHREKGPEELALTQRLVELQRLRTNAERDLKRIPILEERLAKERQGIDTRNPSSPRIQSADEKRLRQLIRNERNVRDIRAEIADMEEQLRTGKFKDQPKRVPPEVDPRLQLAHLKKNLLKAQMEAAIDKTKTRGALDKIVDYGRGVKLAGLGLFAKLGAASGWAMPVETFANILGHPIGSMTVQGTPLWHTASREGRFYLKPEAKAYKTFFSKQSMDNLREVAKKGINSIAAQSGATSHGSELSGIVGRTHGMVKSFLQTAEYNKAFDIRLRRMAEQYERQGKVFDPNDPDVMFQVGFGAATDAQSMILQGETALSRALSHGTTAVERAGQGPIGAPATRVLAAFIKTLTPVTQVPLNYLGKGIRMTGVGVIEGLVRLTAAAKAAKPITLNVREARTLAKSLDPAHPMANTLSSASKPVVLDKEQVADLREAVESAQDFDERKVKELFREHVPLSPEEANEIIRAFKYGGLGLVAAYIGIMQPPWFKAAGYYPRRRKGTGTNPNSKDEPMEPMELEIAGVTIPHYLAHTPFFEAVDFWATIRRGLSIDDFSATNAMTGFGESSSGMIQQVPGLESGVAMGGALVGQGWDIPGTFAEYGRGMLEPQMLNEVAKWTDRDEDGKQIKRDDRGLQKFQGGTPIWRRGLPERGAKKVKAVTW